MRPCILTGIAFTASLLVSLVCAEARTPKLQQIKKVIFSSYSDGWMVGSDRLLKTNDGGRNWCDLSRHFQDATETNPLLGNTGFLDLAVGDGNEVWILLIDQVYKSLDNGENWTRVLDASMVRELCGRCDLEEIGFLGADSVFVLTHRSPPPLRPSGRRLVELGPADSALLTFPRSAFSVNGARESMQVVQLPDSSGLIMHDAHYGTLLRAPKGVLRNSGADWDTLYGSSSHIEDFLLAGATLWVANGGLARFNTLTGSADELYLPDSRRVRHFLFADERSLILQLVDRSGGQAETLIQRFAIDQHSYGTPLVVRGTEAGHFLNALEGWVVVVPPPLTGKGSFCVLHTTDQARTWSLVFNSSSFPQQELQHILEQTIIRNGLQQE